MATEAKIVLSAVDRTSAAFESARRGLAGIGSEASMVSNAVRGIGTAVVVAAMANVIRKTADYADAMGKLSQRTGVTTEALSKLSYAAELSDVSSQELAKGLTLISKEAADGGKKLAALGIATVDAAGKAKTSDQIFREVADRFAGMPDGISKTALAVDLFGEEIGPKLIPLLNAGSAGLKSMGDEAERFGKVVSDDAAKQAEAFNDNLTRLKASADSFSMSIGNALIPELVRLSNEFLTGQKYASGFFDAIFTFGTAKPFEKPAQGAAYYRDELSKLRQARDALLNAEGVTANTAGFDRDIETAAKRLAYFNDLVRQGVSYAGDSQSLAEARRLGLAPPATVPSSGTTRPTGTRTPSAVAAFTGASYDEQITQRVGRLLEESDLIKAREYADTMARLDDLFFSGAIGADLYDSALDKFTKSTTVAGEASTELADQQARLAQLLTGTASAALEDQRRDMELLTAALEKGTITEALYLEAVTARLGLTAPAGQQDPLSSSLASSIEEGILSGFREGKSVADVFLDELKAQFGKTVLRPIIQPIADAGSQILSSLLGSILPSFDGGGFTGYGARSGGLDGQGGYLAMLHPRETVVDHTKGQGAQAPVTVIQNFTVGDVASISMVRQAVAGSEARIAVAMQRSMKYGGALS